MGDFLPVWNFPGRILLGIRFTFVRSAKPPAIQLNRRPNGTLMTPAIFLDAKRSYCGWRGQGSGEHVRRQQDHQG